MAKKFPQSFLVTVSDSKRPIKKNARQVVFDQSEIEAWRKEQKKNIRVQEKFLRTVKRNPRDFPYKELVKEYETYVEKVKKSLE